MTERTESELDLHEDAILAERGGPEAVLKTYESLMAQVDNYPSGSEHFLRVQAVVLNNLVQVVLRDQQGR